MFFLACLCFFLLVWTCWGYGFWVYLCRRKETAEQIDQEIASFTIVLVVCNADFYLERKIQELKNINSPALTKVLILDDGSEDRTKKILKGLTDPRFEVIHLSRQGKSCALNRARKKVSTDLVVLMDVRQKISENDLLKLCGHVSSKTYEACSGKLVMEENPTDYWGWESRLKTWEGSRGHTVGLSGCAAALNKKYWILLPEDCLADDLALGLGVLAKGGRVGFDPSVRVFDPWSPTNRQDLLRKIRTLSGNWQIFLQNKRYFLPTKSQQLFCLLNHKAMRLLLPVWTLGSVVLLLFLKNYYLWAIGILLILIYRKKLIKVFKEFIFLNIAALGAMFFWKKWATKGYWSPMVSSQSKLNL